MPYGTPFSAVWGNSVCLLVFGRSHKECGGLEDDPFVSHVVYLEGT
jgi:hypothetical protein